MTTKTVIMKGQISGTREGADWPPVGGSIELPSQEADQLIAAGLACVLAGPVPNQVDIENQILDTTEDGLSLGTPAQKAALEQTIEKATAPAAGNVPGAAKRAVATPSEDPAPQAVDADSAKSGKHS